MLTPIPTGRRTVRIWFYRRVISSRTKLGARWGRVDTKPAAETVVAGQQEQQGTCHAIFPFYSGLTTADAVVLGDDPGATVSSPDYGIDSLEDRGMVGIEHVATLRAI